MNRVDQCRVCGNLFSFLARGICAECLDNAEAEYRTVRDWLREHPGVSVAEVASQTDVAERRIAAWMAEGRLERLGESSLSSEEELAQVVARRRLMEGMADAGTDDAGTEDRADEERLGMRSRRRS